jgi:hypothetical protein
LLYNGIKKLRKRKKKEIINRNKLRNLLLAEFTLAIDDAIEATEETTVLAEFTVAEEVGTAAEAEEEDTVAETAREVVTADAIRLVVVAATLVTTLEDKVEAVEPS